MAVRLMLKTHSRKPFYWKANTKKLKELRGGRFTH